MKLPIFIEPISTGYRASTGSPLNWTVEAASPEAATELLHGRYASLLASGVRIVEIDVGADDTLARLGALLHANPALAAWDEATREARRRLDLQDEEELQAEREDAVPPTNEHIDRARSALETVP